MKIFNQVPPNTSSINFVDENNVVLGYSLEQNCCENAGWLLSDSDDFETIKKQINDDQYCSVSDKNPISIENEEDYRFDKSYNKYFGFENGEYCQVEIFKIMNIKTNEEKFICIFNSHNGYYSHGFDFKMNKELIIEGSL